MNRAVAACVVVLLISAGTGRAAPQSGKSPALIKGEQASAAVKVDLGDDLSEVSGTVVVTKDKKTGECTDLELLTQSGFKFKITRDGESKPLEAKNGEAVELAGVISMKDGQKWFTIKKPEPKMQATDDTGGGKEVKKAKQAEKKAARKFKFEY